MGGFVALGLVLGVVGFGGSFAVAQRIRRVLVDGKGWIDEQAFVDAFAVAAALPGTPATNLLAMLGYQLAGLTGALGAALAFLAPSIALMIAFGVAYEHLRGVTVVASFLDGMSLATVGVVGAVAVDMRRSTIKTRLGWAIAAGAAAILIARVATLLEVIAAAGLVGVVALRPPPYAGGPRPGSDGGSPPASLHGFVVPAAMAALPSVALLVVFARIGVVTFGGGFAMIAPIEHEVVSQHGWLGESAFNDAMVLGQITPGPVAISATFIGYRVAGLWGAAAATVGMFGPPFALSLLAARSITAFRGNPALQGFLAGIAPAVVGVIAAASVSLWRTTVHSPLGAGLAVGAFALLVWRPKLSPLVPLAAGGVIEWLVHVSQGLRAHG